MSGEQLFVANGLDRIELSRSAGRKVTENNSDKRGKAECQHVDAGTENKRHAHEVRQQNRSAESQDNSEQASEAGEHDGFNKELPFSIPE